jgi:hypothetical protein
MGEDESFRLVSYCSPISIFYRYESLKIEWNIKNILKRGKRMRNKIGRKISCLLLLFIVIILVVPAVLSQTNSQQTYFYEKDYKYYNYKYSDYKYSTYDYGYYDYYYYFDYYDYECPYFVYYLFARFPLLENLFDHFC